MSNTWVVIVILMLVVVAIIYMIVRTMVPSQSVKGWEEQLTEHECSDDTRPAEWQ